MIEKTAAKYSPGSLLEFDNNPLIECLPEIINLKNITENLLVVPPYAESDRERPSEDRLNYLHRLAQLHIPTTNDQAIALNISRCLKWGYVSRNPLTFDQRREALRQKGIELNGDLVKYLHTTTAPIYGFPIIGLSGTGKTTSTVNVLRLMPQVVQHTEYNGLPFNEIQLVWLKVDCPIDATPKGLCSSILRGIDEVLDTNYTSSIMKNRMSKDVLLVKVSQLVQKLHLGILVIDDIQNLCGDRKKVSTEILNFMVSMSNSLQIPIVMVGTPKVLTILQAEFQQAKRASGEGEVRMDLMGRDSKEWNRFINVLWGYQYTKNKVRLTDEMNEAMFSQSVGNPFIAATLYKLVQDDAILSNDEKFYVKDVERIAETKMGMTQNIRKNMLNGVDLEMNMFRNLWAIGSAAKTTNASQRRKKTSPHKTDCKLMELQEMLVARGLSVPDAKKYARQAVTAYPNYEVENLLGYALRLIEEVQASEETRESE